MSDYCVYKHTSPSGKVYIGITCRSNPEIRWNKGHGYSRNIHFRNAIKKYGWDNFGHEIIREGLTHEEANKAETELINQYNSANRSFGYNVSPGGGAWSDETRKKSSEALRLAWGNAQTRDEWVKAITRGQNTDSCKTLKSKLIIASWQNNEIRNRRLAAMRASENTPERKASRARATAERWKNPEIRAKLSAAIKLARNTPESKSLTSKQWKGRVDSEETRKRRSESIKKHFECPDAKRRLSDGIKKGWEDPLTKKRHADGTAKYWEQNTKRVLCVETGAVYESVKIARKETGAGEGIRNCCNKRPHYFTSGGYHWEWADQ